MGPTAPPHMHVRVNTHINPSSLYMRHCLQKGNVFDPVSDLVVFWSDLDPVLKIRSDPNPVLKILSDQDSV